MAGFVLRRLGLAGIAVVGCLAVVFALLHVSGDPSNLMLPPNASEEARQAFREAYGLNRPLFVQFALYLLHAATGDFGLSIRGGRPALDVVLSRAPATFILTASAMLLGVAVGLGGGLTAAVKRGSVLDHIAMLGSVAGQSVPNFWLALMLIWVFAVVWPIFPPSGFDHPSNLVLPAVALSPWLAALVARLSRSSMLEVLHEDYIRTAFAKGVSERSVILVHALRNAIMPTLTVVGLSFAYYMGGAILIEIVFAWPGIGTLMYDSITWRDYPVVLTIVAFVATVFILINLLIDILHAVIDPRVRAQLA